MCGLKMKTAIPPVVKTTGFLAVIFIEVALNRRMPNGMYGGVRGGRDSLLLDYIKAPLSKESGIS